MDNHVHFIVRPQTQNAMSQTICRTHQRYSVYFHSKNKRRGHLWQERYYSCLLQGRHIRQAIRYVECNPVRAKMVERPWQYTFSSARAHVYANVNYKIITLADISEYIDVSSWKEYLLKKEQSRLISVLRKATMKGLVFGSREYAHLIEQKIGRKIQKTPGRPKKRARHD